MDKSKRGPQNQEAIAKHLHDKNERYLEQLKRSGDPADAKAKMLATILDGVADGVVVLDDKLTILMANMAAANMADLHLEDVTREELRRNFKFYASDGITQVPHDQEPMVVAMREKRTHQTEGLIVSRLGSNRKWIRTHAAPLLDDHGNPFGGVTVFNDITERVMLQRQRDCLGALIAHDIKNHLAAEQLFLELLLESNAAQFDPETLKMFNDLCSSSKKFFGIANSLLETFRTRFFSGTDSYESADMLALVNEAIQLSELEAASRKVRVDVTCAGEFTRALGLPRVLFHIIHNVVQNAVEASPPDSAVSVAVSSNDYNILVDVTDTGAGMTPEEVASLFDPLKVAGHGTGPKRSSGFGLYLSAMLAEGQGGSIRCKSEKKHGTKMTITIPRPDSN